MCTETNIYGYADNITLHTETSNQNDHIPPATVRADSPVILPSDMVFDVSVFHNGYDVNMTLTDIDTEPTYLLFGTLPILY